ncbi:MAG: hypothetical protein KC800_16805 [Candidatus Eremiobacteraeota bacterium]|nr:hypothetical protein [Candidatus Eremiobacteraeota bacterium]
MLKTQILPLFLLLLCFVTPANSETLDDWFSPWKGVVSEIQEDGFHLKCHLQLSANEAQDAFFDAFLVYGGTLDMASRIDSETKIESSPIEVSDGELTRRLVFKITMQELDDSSVAVDIESDFSVDPENKPPDGPSSLLRAFLRYTLRSARPEDQ